MYNPVKDGIDKTVQSVSYTVAQPTDDLVNIVHSFWELKTEATLKNDFHLHVLPDACVNILFNLLNPNIAAVTARKITYVDLNLGKDFHYAGIQFLPGVWQGSREEIIDGFVDQLYAGTLPLIKVANQLTKLDNFAAKQAALTKLVNWLKDQNLVAENTITAKILSDINNINTVAEMAARAGVSPRQLQRILKQTTGFSPHDFLKVLRLQNTFKNDYLLSYTDQSHFINSFRKLTGHTPAEYFKNFDV